MIFFGKFGTGNCVFNFGFDLDQKILQIFNFQFSNSVSQKKFGNCNRNVFQRGGWPFLLGVRVLALPSWALPFCPPWWVSPSQFEWRFFFLVWGWPWPCGLGVWALAFPSQGGELVSFSGWESAFPSHGWGLACPSRDGGLALPSRGVGWPFLLGVWVGPSFSGCGLALPSRGVGLKKLRKPPKKNIRKA